MAEEYEKESEENETSEHEDGELLTKIREDYESAQSYWSDFYTRMEDDIDFLLGEGHWDDLPEDSPNKVKLVINKCPSFVNNIVNEMRSYRPAIRTLPDDDDATEETAEVRAGLVRKIEYKSNAETAYDVAAKFQVISGLGWLSVRTEWIPGTWKQRIIIDKHHDFSRVLLDPKSVEMDGSDARFGFILSVMSKDEFKAEYPDAQPVDFDGKCKAWVKDKQIIVVEYYYLECETQEVYEMSRNGELDTLLGSKLKELEGVLGYKPQKLKKGEQDPLDGIVRIVRSRKEKVDVVKWCKTNGQEILERTDWLDDRIPIVPVYGNTIWNNGKRHVSGLISVMRDPQIMLNYWESSNTEVVALQPKSPWIAAEGQIEEYAEMWKDANRKNYPVLTYQSKVVTKNGQPVGIEPPPQRQMPPQLSAGMLQMAINSGEHLKSVTGIYDASQGKETGQERSGKAILALQRQGDTASYHYIDNQAKAITAIGKIVNNLLTKLDDGKPRNERIVGEDRKESVVRLNAPTEMRNAQDGSRMQGIHRMDKGTYEVSVTVGPSYASKRQESLEAQLELAQIMPETFSVAADLIADNIDAPGMKEIAKRLRKALPPGLADDEQTPEQLALMKAQEAVELFKNQLIELQKQLDSKTRSENLDFQIKKEQNKIKEQEVEIKAFEAQIEAFKVQAETGRIPNAALNEIMSTIRSLKEGNDDVTATLNLLLSEDEGITPQAPQNATISPQQETPL